jgi:hypothetical protein
MLDAVMPHAGGEDAMPALEAVLFEVRGGTLYLAATDRYSMGIARCQIPGAQAAPVPDASALVPICVTQGELPGLLEGSDVTAAVVFGDDGLTVDTGSASGRYATDPHPEHFPDWRALMPEFLAGEPAEMGTYTADAAMLARFAVTLAPRDDEYTVAPLAMRVVSPRTQFGVPLHSGERHPVILFARKDWFVGVASPIRRRAADEPHPDPWAEWTAALTPPQPVPASAA